MAAPLIGQPESKISAELVRSGQLVAQLSQPEAEALVTQLGDLGLEVFIDPMPGPPRFRRASTDPLHGLASLSAAVPLAEALDVDGDEGSTGVFDTPEEAAGESSVEKPPRVRPSQEIEPVELPPGGLGSVDPFREAATGLPPPIEGAPPLLDIMPPSPSNPVPAVAPTPPDEDPTPGASRWPLIVLGLLLLGGVVWFLTRPADQSGVLADARAAAAVGQYDKALTLAAQARADGADGALVDAVTKVAQAGPLLDAAESHLAAQDWAKARASLDAAAGLAPDLPRLKGLRIRLKKDASTADLAQPQSVRSRAPQTVAAAPQTVAAAPRTVAPQTAAPVSVAAPETDAPITDAPTAVDRGEPSKPSTSKKRARLRIDAPRRAAIFVDGRKTGRYTPSTVRLRPGDHRIVLRNPDNGQVWAEREVRAVSGRSSRIAFSGREFAPAKTTTPPKAPATQAPATQAAPRITTLGSGADGSPKTPKSRVDMIGAPATNGGAKSENDRVQRLGQ